MRVGETNRDRMGRVRAKPVSVGGHMGRGTSVCVPERSSRGRQPVGAIRGGIKGKDTLSIPHGSASSVWSDVLRPIGSKGRRRGLKGVLGREGMEGHGVGMVGGHGWGLEGCRCSVGCRDRVGARGGQRAKGPAKNGVLRCSERRAHNLLAAVGLRMHTVA